MNNIENNLSLLEKSIGSSSFSNRTIVYSTVAAIVSLFLFRPLYMYKKNIKGNKAKKMYLEEYSLCYYRLAGCFLAYMFIYYMFFRYYLKI